MPDAPHICFTFVGDVTRDSRLRRFRQAAAEIGRVSLVSTSLTSSTSLRRELPRFWRRGREEARALHADLYLAADLYSLPIAAAAARHAGSPLIYDARELYSAVAALVGRPVMQRFWSLLEQRYARRAHTVLTVNASIADILRKDYSSVHVIRNFPDWPLSPDRSLSPDRTLPPDRSLSPDRPFPSLPPSSSTANLLRETLGIGNDRVLLLSQGGLQRGRGALLCIDALSDLPACDLVFLGDGAMREEILLHAQVQQVADRVHMLPAVPSEELQQWTASADIGLCMIENLGRSYYLSLPNKLFEYIGAGLAVVGSDFPEIGRVLRESGAGVAVAPEAGLVAEAVRTLIDEPAALERLRENSRTTAAAYHWDREKPVFQEILVEILKTV